MWNYLNKFRSKYFNTVESAVKHLVEYCNALVYLCICFSVIDANHTCDWSAPAAVYAEKDSVIGSFSPAPVDFGFSMYNIFLIDKPLVLMHLTINATDNVSLMLLLLILGLFVFSFVYFCFLWKLSYYCYNHYCY